MKTFSLAGLLVAVGCVASCSKPFGDAPGLDSGVVPVGPEQFRFVTTATRTQVVQGKATSVPIVITRGSGAASDIQVTLTSPPAGITADPLTIPSGSSTGQLSITVADTINQGNLDGLAIQGHAVGGNASDTENLPLFVRGKPGALDTTFASDGVYQDAWGSYTSIQSVIPQQNGTILIGAQVLGLPNSTVLRLNADGSVDATFANPNILSPIDNMAVSANGNIVITSVVSQKSVITRLTGNGTLDTTFNGTGSLTLSSIPNGWPNFTAAAITIASDESIYVGSSDLRLGVGATIPDPYGIIQIQPNGQFGTESFSSCVGFWSSQQELNSLTSLLIHPTTGALVLTGNDGAGIGVIRYQPLSCARDPQYGGGTGIAYFKNWQDLDDSFLEADGSIDLLARVDTGGIYSLVHINATGTQMNNVSTLAYSTGRGGGPTGGVTRAPDGHILVAGEKLPAGNSSMAVAYYKSDLTLDTLIGNQGIVTIPITLANTFGVGLRAIYTPDGQKTIVVGVAHRTDGETFVTSENLVVARIWN